MKSKYQILGNEIEITIKTVSTRFGQKYSATNNYGETKQTVKAFNSAREAVEAEIKELEAMFS
jgi:hypothetical protein